MLGDLLFVLTGLMFAVFGTLLRHWRVNAFSAATVISVLSLSLLPLYAAFAGFARVAALGLGENALQALAQGILAGPAALYLFAFSIQTIGVARAAVFPATVPALTILIGWLLLGEPPTALQAAGLVTVLFGILSGATAAVGSLMPPLRAQRSNPSCRKCRHGLLRCARNDVGIVSRILAARLRPRFAYFRCPLKNRGRREDRVHAAPAVSCAIAHGRSAHEHTGTGGASRPSLRSGFTAYFVLSPVNGSFATVAGGILLRKLDASTAASGPHDFAVRSSLRSSCASCRVHRIPPRVRDVRNAPLIG